MTNKKNEIEKKQVKPSLSDDDYSSEEKSADELLEDLESMMNDGNDYYDQKTCKDSNESDYALDWKKKQNDTVFKFDQFFNDMILVSKTITYESIFALENFAEKINNNYLKGWIDILVTYWNCHEIKDVLSKHQKDIKSLLKNRKISNDDYVINNIVLSFIDSFINSEVTESDDVNIISISSLSKQEQKRFSDYYEMSFLTFMEKGRMLYED